MIREGLVEQLESISEFFERSTSCLSEEDSAFLPRDGTFTTAQQVAHTAQTIDWFVDGMFNPSGFDLDFEKHTKITMACSSLDSARDRFSKAVANAIEVIGKKSDGELNQSLPDGPVMGGAPRFAVVGAIADHTAHHRGALTVYSRLLGKVPKMPYADM
jgi:uncharacterized damage-inducible protein DinB